LLTCSRRSRLSWPIETAPPFDHQLKRLSKKYPSLPKAIRELCDSLGANPLVGKAIPGFGGKVRKIRVAGRDQQRGKSGGFRVLYFAVTPQGTVVLMALYAKAEMATLSIEETKAILKQYPDLFSSRR
jgi:mRNA-degrading endonuclease RelE of RelBE toxin-antitoxin system